MNRRDVALWTAILACPVIWFAQQLANFALAPWACRLGWKPAQFVVSIVCLAVVASFGLLARSEWQQLGRASAGEAGGAVPRSRALAAGGMALSGMFFLVILAQGIVESILDACQ